MSSIQKWHQVIMNVQNANLNKEKVQKSIKKLNKIMYKKQLDRQVQQKHYTSFMMNQQKQKQKQQATRLAQAQKLSKIKQKQIKSQIQRRYGDDNLNLLDYNHKVKTASKQMQRVNIKSFLQHPFVKLVDQQENRKKQMRNNLIKQNQINQIQQQIKKNIKHVHRSKQAQERNNFVNYIEYNHQKRSQQRQKFKNKYLRLKKGQVQQKFDKNNKNMSVQQMYFSYLNKQMNQDRTRKLKEKSQYIDDKRIQQMYSKNIQPDSSPAYLGRNPLNYERRRQLYYINKHLSTNHQDSIASAFQSQGNKNLESHLRNLSQLNPEQKPSRRLSYNLNKNSNQNQNRIESTELLPYHLNGLNKDWKEPSSWRSIDKKSNNIFFDNNKTKDKNNNISNQIDKFLQFQNNNRRIKSQFSEEKYKQNFNLPNVNLKQVMSSYSTQNNAPKKQYQRYDFITGKNISYYV